MDTIDPISIFRFALERQPAAILAFDDFHLLSAAMSAVSIGVMPWDTLPSLLNARFKDRTPSITNSVTHPIRFVTRTAESVSKKTLHLHLV
jgi:hypothetical protein